jgi:hypothetical protein
MIALRAALRRTLATFMRPAKTRVAPHARSRPARRALDKPAATLCDARGRPATPRLTLRARCRTCRDDC